MAMVASAIPPVSRHQALPSGAQSHLQAILEGVSANARYPDDADDALAGIGPQSEADAQAARDEQGAVEERRRELFVLLKNVAKLSFEEAVGFVGRALQAAVTRRQASFQVGEGRRCLWPQHHAWNCSTFFGDRWTLKVCVYFNFVLCSCSVWFC